MPTPVSTTQTITVTATSVADTSKSGTATIALNTTIHIGDGAPPPALHNALLIAYQRGAFSRATSRPPLGNVKALGSTGYVQEFADANNTSSVKLALATADMATYGSLPPVYQIYSPLYVYHTSVGVGTAGYPTGDSQPCPQFDSVNSCVYGIFDKGVALFAYTNALATGQNFSITSTFYMGGTRGNQRPREADYGAGYRADRGAHRATDQIAVAASQLSAPLSPIWRLQVPLSMCVGQRARHLSGIAQAH